MQHPIVQTIKSRLVVLKSPSELTYLDLSDIKCQILPKEAGELLEKCDQLYQLNLNNCGLNSLENLPKLNLGTLLLDQNYIQGQQVQKLTIYRSSLQILSLKKNYVESLQSIAFLQQFNCLAELNLKGNPLCLNCPNYNVIIFNQIMSKSQKFRIVDCFRKNGEILSDEENNDQNLGGPEWLMEPNSEDIVEQQNQHDQESLQEKYYEMQFGQKKQKLIQMYEKQVNDKKFSTFLVGYLNQNCTFNDPLDNCLSEEQDNFNPIFKIKQFQQQQLDQEGQQKSNNLFQFKTIKKRKHQNQ